MDYFNLLEFKKEPFSNSPEPEFLFASAQHNTCLQMLELAVRLKRGLNIVIGAVGTGKTTLCRKLIQNLSLPAAHESSTIETFLLLDPAVESKFEFVKTVAGVLGINISDTEDKEWHIKEKIKKFLFEKGVDEQKIIALIIDEGQKIPDDCLEILREFLNYETNDFKLLQIVIFAQSELRKSLAARANLLDRVNYLYYLKPLSFRQMKSMIEYRISVAGRKPDDHSLLSFGGLLAVYWATAGYPRKVVSLCHQVVLMMIIKGKSEAGWFLVRRCVHKMAEPAFRKVRWATLGAVVAAVLAFSGIMYFSINPIPSGGEITQRVLSGIDIKKEYFTSASRHIHNDQLGAVIPETLGTIKLKKRMTIWRVFENIYGDSNEDIKRRFIQANPQIKNLNDTSEGTIINVPAIPTENNPFKEKPILVSLEESNELAGIYYSFIRKNNPANLPALMFMSLWSKKNGKQFLIVLDKRFSSSEEAQNAIAKLPQGLSRSARVLTKWEEGAIGFNRRLRIDTTRSTEGG